MLSSIENYQIFEIFQIVETTRYVLNQLYIEIPTDSHTCVSMFSLNAVKTQHLSGFFLLSCNCLFLFLFQFIFIISCRTIFHHATWGLWLSIVPCYTLVLTDDLYEKL